MRLMACMLAIVAMSQLDSCQPPKTGAPGPQPALMAAGNLNNLDVLQVTAPGEFHFWRRDARGAWTDGGTGEGNAAAIAAWREDLLVFFDTGRYAQFGLKETRVSPSPVPAWTPAAVCEDGLAVEAFGWNVSGEPILARSDGGKWTWQRVEADLVRDRARDVRLVHFAGRPYLVWREEAEPLLPKTAPAAWRVRFIYQEGGRWQPVTSRLVVASAPLVASDGERLIFLYQKPGEGAAWTLASYLVSDEDWHETGAVSGATIPPGPVVLARQGSQFFVVAPTGGGPQTAPLDPATGRLGPLAPPAVEKAAAPDEVTSGNLAMGLAMAAVALALLALGWRQGRRVARGAPAPAAPAVTAGAARAAPLVRRAVACAFDYMLIAVLCVAGLAAFSPEFRAHLAAAHPPPAQDLANLTLLGLVRLPYFIVCEIAFGRTLGKRIFGLKVVHENGGRASAGQTVARNLLRLVDELPALYILGMALVLMGPRPQRLGDRLARTLVVTAPATPMLAPPSGPPGP